MLAVSTCDRNMNKWKTGAPDSANRYFYCCLFIVMGLTFFLMAKLQNEKTTTNSLPT